MILNIFLTINVGILNMNTMRVIRLLHNMFLDDSPMLLKCMRIADYYNIVGMKEDTFNYTT